MAMRDQHDVDLRQLLEGDAGIVVPLRSGEADRRDPLRPDRVNEDVEAAGLDQPAGMADEGEPQPIAVDPRRRGVGMGAGRPVGPFGAIPLAAELPAQHLAQRLWRCAVRIEEGQAVEMVGDRAVIGFHVGHPERGNTDQRAGAGKQSENTAAGDRHGRASRDGWGGKASPLYGRSCRKRNPSPETPYFQSVTPTKARRPPNFP